MKGVVFNVLEEVFVAEQGLLAWDEALLAAGADGAYSGLGSYSDEEFLAIVEQCQRARGDVDIQDTIEWIGLRGARVFHRKYRYLFAPTLMEMILSLNGVIHPEVFKLYPGAQVPEFGYQDVSASHVRLAYSSPRRLCRFAEGLLRGAGEIYGESIDVTQARCEHRGDPACLIEVQILAP